MNAQDTFIATNRFGLGATQADWMTASRGPHDWLSNQLGQRDDPGPEVRDSAVTLAAALNRLAGGRRRKKADAKPGSCFREIRSQVAAQLQAQLAYAVRTETPFRERLVRFWSNHFCVSRLGQPMITASCLAYEQEAIRAHLDGSFAEMLLAVEQHPVMLGYLDNLQSIGPRSMAGRRLGRGLNENLAREILELHCLGVAGGYDQADVTSLARILTGWTVADGRHRRGKPGTYCYVTFMHEPGNHRLLGKRYPEDGKAQGEHALRDLAAHPATAHHVATKLVRHLVADNPPPRAVAAIEQAFLGSAGDLPTVHRALLELPEAWTVEHRKFKSPQELVISGVRGIEPRRLPDRALAGSLKVLNQMPFGAPSPAGWPDTTDDWASPRALKTRLEWGVQLGRRAGSSRDARTLAERHSAPGSGARRAVARAESPGQALALLFAGPDFQWRV